MKVFVSQSAEITEAYLKRKIKIGIPKHKSTELEDLTLLKS